MPRSIRRVVVAALLLLVPSISSAQIGGQGSIQGTVLDTSKAAPPRRHRNCYQRGHRRRVTSSESTGAGLFVVAPLPAGTYKVSATAAGFRTVVHEDKSSSRGSLTTVEMEMKLEVGATAGGASRCRGLRPGAEHRRCADGADHPQRHVHFAAAEHGQWQSAQSRGIYLRACPASRRAAHSDSSTVVRASRRTSISRVCPLPMPCVQGESRWLFSSACRWRQWTSSRWRPAELRLRFNGQGSENYTIKSGTNQFHGSMFEYFRNTVLDAKAYFATIKPDDNQQRVRGHGRRTDPEEPDVFLRDLRRVSRSAADRVRADVGPDPGAAKRRFQRVAGDDLRSADHEAEPERYRLCPRPVSQQHHSAGPDLVDLAGTSSRSCPRRPRRDSRATTSVDRCRSDSTTTTSPASSI